MFAGGHRARRRIDGGNRRGGSGGGKGEVPEKPFVVLAQQSLFDRSRAPAGKEVAWGYCHVPNGCPRDLLGAIENQIERFAPGFRERILDRHTTSPAQLENYNSNCIGGDISGGANDIGQLFTRPLLQFVPYASGLRGSLSMFGLDSAWRRIARDVRLPRRPGGAAAGVENISR